jgi:hypothetical protein
MKIIQLLKMPDNFTYQGALWGLGDDGKVYEWHSLDGISGWKLALDSVMYKAPEAIKPDKAVPVELQTLRTCPECGKEEFSSVLENTTKDLCDCIPF